MVFKALDKRNQTHEQIIFCSDASTGLKAIIAIHSTRLGPAVGGCRMFPYKTEEQALEDVLRLSEAMSYKAVMAGLKMGGGKSVIIADPEKDKNPELLRAFGRHIESLNGRYIVGKDMGITTEDLQSMGKQSPYILGRPLEKGGVGDPSQSTAKGVYYGIKEAVRWKLKKDSLKGIRVLVQGLGAVGCKLVEFLSQEQADLFVFDIKKSILDKVKSQVPNAKILSEKDVFKTSCEVFAPCSVGSVINEQSVEQLNCSIVAGGANNQLSTPLIEKKLIEKDILYIPDFVINSGGLIYLSAYISPKKSEQWLEDKIKGIAQSVRQVCERSLKEKTGTAQMALDLAKEGLKA